MNMPNHCHSDLYVEGSADDVAALLKLVGADKEQPEFEFSSVIPYPEHWAKLDKEMSELGWKGFEDRYGKGAKDGFNSGGYEWCCANWGTKWGAYAVKRRDYLGACVTFQTAWTTPAPVIVALHKLFPKCSLHLEWFERGYGKCGGFSCVSEDNWHNEGDEPWAPGAKQCEWEGDYCGLRGG
jgi:Ferredoxin-like domain in Api92-like protein